MTLERWARALYALLFGLSRRAQEQATTVWRELDPAALQASWNDTRAADRLLIAVGSAQLAAATRAEPFVTGALGVQGVTSDPLGELVPDSLAGIASDGRDLDALLLQPLIQTLDRLAHGAPTLDAMRSGETSLALIAGTQVADAGRAAIDVEMATDRAVRGWVRVLQPPSCGRCAILAGRFYRWSEGFERHPGCDCIHVPASEDAAGDLRTDPKAYFDSLTEAEQDRYFTKAGADAIRQGADISQVVNARRGAAGLSRPGRLTEAEQQMLRSGRRAGRLDRVDVYGRQLAVTNEGTTRRSTMGKRFIAEAGAKKGAGERYARSRTPRLMPEAIAEIAGGDRDEQVRLLRRFGYITT